MWEALFRFMSRRWRRGSSGATVPEATASIYVWGSMPLSPTYRTALITGAAGALGREMALLLARQGTAIAAVDVRAEGLEALSQLLEREGHSCAWAVADVVDTAAMQIAATHLEEQLGPIDLLIANAGLGYETSALAIDGLALATLIQVNLVGVANSVAAVLPGMLERGRGHLVAISSMASLRGMPLMLGYSASKAGVNVFMEGLHTEVEPHGLAVSTICPGFIRTPMTATIHNSVPLMEPAEAARIIVRAIGKRKRFFAFPRRLAWQLALLRWLPTGWADWLVRRFFKKMQATQEKPAPAVDHPVEAL
jgi:short-subunit dehydrogenase